MWLLIGGYQITLFIDLEGIENEVPKMRVEEQRGSDAQENCLMRPDGPNFSKDW